MRSEMVGLRAEADGDRGLVSQNGGTSSSSSSSSSSSGERSLLHDTSSSQPSRVFLRGFRSRNRGVRGSPSHSSSWDASRCTLKNLSSRLYEAVLQREFWKGAWENLKKSWISRLVRATKLSAFIVLALHINLEMSARGFKGSNFVLITYSLCATVLPDYSSSLYSAIWVWLLTLLVAFLVTLLAFFALYAGGVGGPFAALGVILILFSWVSVIRIPLLYRVPPFREAIDSSHLGKVALTFIPYNTCCMLLRLRHLMQTFSGISDGARYLFVYVTWSMAFTLVGLSLFALQIATPPWNSQKAIVRNQLTRHMLQVAEALKALHNALELISKTFTASDEGSFTTVKADLEVSAAAMSTAVDPLLQILGSQSALRTRLVESGREPSWLCPGPGINVMPEMARIQMVLLQASMHLVGAAKQLSCLVNAMERVAVKRSRALASNVDELCHSVRLAHLVCQEGAALLALGPALRLFCSPDKAQLAVEAKRLLTLREHMEAVRMRSLLGHGPLTRQPSVGAEMAERAQGLLQKTGVFLIKQTSKSKAVHADAVQTEEEGSGAETDSEGRDEEQTQQQALLLAGDTQQQNEDDEHQQQQQQQQWFAAPAAADRQELEEAAPLHASDKPTVKTRLRMLRPRAMKRQRGAAGDRDSFEKREVEAQLYPSAPAYITLPTLELQSSHTFSLSVNRVSPADSLFENASLFETNAIGAAFPGAPSAAVRPVDIAHADGSACSSGSKSAAASARTEENREDLSTLRSRRSSLKDSTGPATVGEARGKNNVQGEGEEERQERGRALDTAASPSPAVAGSSAPAAAQGVERAPLHKASLGPAPARLRGFDSAEEQHELLECLSRGVWSIGQDNFSPDASRASFFRFLSCGVSGENLRGAAARDALAEIGFLPKHTSAVTSAPLAGDKWIKRRDGLQEARRRKRSSLENKALRYQVKLTMFVVSLIQIASKDSLDFCAAFESLLYSDLTPSWNRFCLNIRMLFLSGTIMGMQFSRGLSDIFCFWRWRLTGEEAWFNDVDVVHCLKFVVGITGLYAVGVFLDEEITLWLVGSLDMNSAVMPVSSWMMLGFVSTTKWTFEGTVHTAASPDVYSTFHPEFGYIGQVFLWTCVYIYQTVWLTMPSSTSSPPALKLNVTNSRLGGNIVGIAAAVVMSYCPPYFSSETEVRFLCRSLMGDCSRCITLIGNAFVKSVLPPAQSLVGRQSGLLQHDKKAGIRLSPQEQTDSTAGQAPTCAAACEVPFRQGAKKSSPSPLACNAEHENAGVPFLKLSGEHFSAELDEAPCEQEREARWKRGFFGIGFLAKPETFNRLPTSAKLTYEEDDKSFGCKRLKRHKRKKIHFKLRERARALKSKHLSAHFWLRRQNSRQLVL
ncbi:hypothetical protein Esti_005892 [Eimeria stiedai]